LSAKIREVEALKEQVLQFEDELKTLSKMKEQNEAKSSHVDADLSTN
jgi:predicted  nucleic acid-binding Zn-ribbon protein